MRDFPLKSKGFNPFGELLGLDFTKIDPGISHCTLEIRPALLNPNGVLHGGVLYSMADSGMAAALYTTFKENENCATIEIKIVYFKPATAGSLICEAKILHRGNKVATLEAEIRIENSISPQEGNTKLLAKALGTFYILKESS